MGCVCCGYGGNGWGEARVDWDCRDQWEIRVVKVWSCEEGAEKIVNIEHDPAEGEHEEGWDLRD